MVKIAWLNSSTLSWLLKLSWSLSVPDSLVFLPLSLSVSVSNTHLLHLSKTGFSSTIVNDLVNHNDIVCIWVEKSNAILITVSRKLFAQSVSHLRLSLCHITIGCRVSSRVNFRAWFSKWLPNLQIIQYVFVQLTLRPYWNMFVLWHPRKISTNNSFSFHTWHVSDLVSVFTWPSGWSAVDWCRLNQQRQNAHRGGRTTETKTETETKRETEQATGD